MTAAQRTTPATFDAIPGELPQGSVPEGVNLHLVAQDAVVKLNSLQESHLLPNAIWRDLLSLTGHYRTFYSAAKVFTTLTKLSDQKRRSTFRIKEGREPRLARGGGETTWVDIDVLFTAQHDSLPENCMGTISVILDVDGKWRIWMLRTWLECFDGHGHPDVLDPDVSTETDVPRNITNGAVNGAASCAHVNASDKYGAVVVGAGQAGLSTAGRLKALDIPYVLLEKHATIGDAWAQRYESLRWHTSKESGNLPFGHTFPEEDDYMLPTKRIAAGFKAWAETYGLNIELRTTVDSVTWDDATRIWTINTSSPNGQTSIQATNLVLAIGPGHATPIYPPWALPEEVKASNFKGTVLHAFGGYYSATQWAGKRGIVVGTANTAHDIAEDMANAGMQTTMVQRSPTFVFPAEWLHRAEDLHYNTKMETSDADREAFTYPNKIMREITNRHVHAGIRASPQRFDALEEAGFKVDRYGDIYNNLYVRFGGHYVDIGCSARIAKGEIKVKTEPVKGLTEDSLLFEDGQEVGADVIVLCTGFDKVFRNDAARVVGPGVANSMDDFWGLDAEGEIRGLAKFAGHPNLYYHGGDVRMARFFSRFIALQIQADLLGRPLQPYLE